MSKTKINSKRSKEQKMGLDVEKIVMKKIKNEEIKIKPRWLFIAGSAFAFIGITGLTFGAIFLVNLMVFLVKKKGPGLGRLELMLNSFPVWIPILAMFAITLGIILLKRFEFSYKKNFLLIVFVFVLSIILSGFVIDELGLNRVWSNQRPMRKFYQQFEKGSNVYPKNGNKNNILNHRRNY